ncbi:MAG: DUF488 domain-containing protein [Pirellulaceae bacterium]
MIFSIGHSNVEQNQFVQLLQQHAIEVLVDVRTSPYSRYTSHFNREVLKAAIEPLGIRYLFMGEQLGGRPTGDDFYDANGHVLYSRVAEADFFLSGVERLKLGGQKFRVAMMCSEEDPTVCHRFLLVSRVLSDQGETVTHIRGDGSLQTDRELRISKADLAQQLLFPELEQETWKSLRSVLPKAPPPTSLED